MTDDARGHTEQKGTARPAPDHILHRRADWGPLEIAAESGHVHAWVPGSSVASIVAPASRGMADPETLQLLKDGLPVHLGDEEMVTLQQPTRSALRRRDRAIRVDGPPDLVPPGTILRARGYYSMGLEIEGDRRLVHPRLDLLDAPFLWGLSARDPVVDPSVKPDLLAVWGAASWHLLATVLQ